MEHTAVVVLAAGASSRLGRPKQLLDYRGKPLLQHILDQAAPLPADVRLLLLGANAGPIQEALIPGDTEVMQNDNWQEGIASSIRLGVERVQSTRPHTTRILFLLSDQPLVTTDILIRLLALHTDSALPIAACGYAGIAGVPAVFSASLFPELLRLHGDQGAGRLIRQYTDHCAVLPFPGGAVDVDTEGDYEGLSMTFS